MMQLFHTASERCSQHTTEIYSTSFSSAIKLLHKDLRQPIFNVYGFVRLADEIVDSFHQFDKQQLLQKFKADTYEAIATGLSLNPILHSFQRTVNEYGIGLDLIDAFFHSMEMDLYQTSYDCKAYNDYIYGSAEVVGLMCLLVFCEGNKNPVRKIKSKGPFAGCRFSESEFPARFESRL